MTFPAPLTYNEPNKGGSHPISIHTSHLHSWEGGGNIGAHLRILSSTSSWMTHLGGGWKKDKRIQEWTGG